MLNRSRHCVNADMRASEVDQIKHARTMVISTDDEHLIPHCFSHNFYDDGVFLKRCHSERGDVGG